MHLHNNFGILYQPEKKYTWFQRVFWPWWLTRPAPTYLYKRYATIEDMAEALKSDEKLKELQLAGATIYTVDVTDCPLPVKTKDKEKTNG